MTPYDVIDDVKIIQVATILVKPSGLQEINYIINQIQDEGVDIIKCLLIKDYKKYAKSIFHMVSSEEQNIWFRNPTRKGFLWRQRC